jgi:ribosomal protein S18 acetylase RimI-like enzyme
MNEPVEPKIEIKALTEISLDTLREIIVGHTSHEVFSVHKIENDTEIGFRLQLKPLPEPVKNTWQPDQGDLEEYEKAFAQRTCLGAYLSDKLVGVAIAECRHWNKTLWVWEFHVHPEYHRRGIGWLMMEEMVDLAKEKGMRVVVCETQNTNVTAIRFYRAMGFTMDGVDLSYYSNEDYRNDAVAVFMKRKI